MTNFKAYLSEIYSVFTSMNGYKADYTYNKMTIAKGEREECVFSFSIVRKDLFEKYSEEWKDEEIEGHRIGNQKFYWKLYDEMIDYIKFFAHNMNAKSLVEDKNTFDICSHFGGLYGDMNPTVAFDVKTIEGYDVSIAANFGVYNNEVYFYFSCFFKGDKVEVKRNFDDFPEIKNGAILVHVYGYNCTHATFYLVKNRSKSRFTFVELDSTYADGDWMNGSIAPVVKEKTRRILHTGMIGKDGSLKSKGKSFRVWDKKPVYVNCD